MDWNTVLLWNAVLISALTLVRLLASPLKTWDWIAVTIGLLAATAAMWVFHPEIAGYCSAIVCGLLLITPAVLQQRINLLVQGEHFAKAANLSLISQWLHPFGIHRHQAALLRARLAAAKGDRAAALALFERLSVRPGQMGLIARIHVLQLQHAWAEIVQIFQRDVGESSFASQIVLLRLYLRALAETGEVSRMVRIYQRYERDLDRQGLEPIRRLCRIVLFAFTGEASTVEKIFEMRRPSPGPETRALMLGTAELAAGRTEAAHARLEPLTRSTNCIVAQDARYRLEHGPAGVGATLPPEERAIVAKVAAEIEHEIRFLKPTAQTQQIAAATWTLVSLNLAMFAVEIATGGSDN